MQVFEIRLALQLHCGAQSRHRAAGKAFCHAGKVITQLQHLLQLPHLHLIGGCCPVRQRSCLSQTVGMCSQYKLKTYTGLSCQLPYHSSKVNLPQKLFYKLYLNICIQACRTGKWSKSGAQTHDHMVACKPFTCQEHLSGISAWVYTISQQAQKQSNTQCVWSCCVFTQHGQTEPHNRHTDSRTDSVWSCHVFTRHGQTEPHNRHRDSQTDNFWKCLVFIQHGQGADLDPNSLAHRPCATSLTACAASCMSCSRGPHWVRGVRPAFSPSSSTPRTLLHCSKQA